MSPWWLLPAFWLGGAVTTAGLLWPNRAECITRQWWGLVLFWPRPIVRWVLHPPESGR